MMHRQPIGWQIVHSETDNPPPQMDSFEVYPLDFVVRWFAGLTDDQKPSWRCMPIFEGDVEEPSLCFVVGNTVTDEEVKRLLPPKRET